MAIIALIGGIQFTWTLSAFTVLLYYGITNIAALNAEQQRRFVSKWVSLIGLLSCLSLVALSVISQIVS
ncbi:hypothetical protein [Alteromonas gracilis]|uniref:hypothetical protein n=1 Tax=Alteromonas gracilis TaxID=1479524 RepID=UPI00373676BA